MSKYLIEFDKVKFGYSDKYFFRKPKHIVLNELSFHLKSGESLAVLGKNGAGKSTILKLLAGILMPDSGVITTSAKRISLLTLQAGFVEHLSGEENFVLGGLMMGLSYSRLNELKKSVLDLTELGDSFYDPLSTYSAGMKARLGFATVMFVEPDVFLIDETLGVGDKDFKKKSEKIMREKILGNSSSIIVSHDEHTIKELCSRAICIKNGEVAMDGDVSKVLDYYMST